MSQPTPPHPTPPPHYQPGPPGYQPSPPGYAPPRKKRRWPWIVGGIVAFFVIIGIAAGAGGNTGPTGNGGPAGAPAASGGEVVYEVTSQGRGTATSITYVTNAQFNQAQENGATLPWTKTVDLGNGLFSMASVVAQAGDGVSSITCKITKNGEVLVENTSTGQYALVTCSGS